MLTQSLNVVKVGRWRPERARRPLRSNNQHADLRFAGAVGSMEAKQVGADIIHAARVDRREHGPASKADTALTPVSVDLDLVLYRAPWPPAPRHELPTDCQGKGVYPCPLGLDIEPCGVNCVQGVEQLPPLFGKVARQHEFSVLMALDEDLHAAQYRREGFGSRGTTTILRERTEKLEHDRQTGYSVSCSWLRSVTGVLKATLVAVLRPSANEEM
jgi:hypothetical protein